MSTSLPTTFLLLHSAVAPKLGLRSAARIGYQLLTDTDRQHLYLALTDNDGGGYFSREIVPFAAVEACLDGHDACQPFPSKRLVASFQGRSSNNAPFLCAALRDLGLLLAAPGKPFQHAVADGWAGWIEAQLARPGEPFTPPVADKAKPAVAVVEPDPAPAGLPKISRKDRKRQAQAAKASTVTEEADANEANQASEALHEGDTDDASEVRHDAPLE